MERLSWAASCSGAAATKDAQRHATMALWWEHSPILSEVPHCAGTLCTLSWTFSPTTEIGRLQAIKSVGARQWSNASTSFLYTYERTDCRSVHQNGKHKVVLSGVCERSPGCNVVQCKQCSTLPLEWRTKAFGGGDKVMTTTQLVKLVGIGEFLSPAFRKLGNLE